MLLIYSHKITNRLTYTCNLLFKDLGKCEFEITKDKKAFDDYSGPKLCYSYRRREGDMAFIRSVELLYENGIKDLDLKVSDWEDTICLFPTDQQSDLPFDVFASSFFMTSRYEEYLPHMRDLYDRFDAQMSIADQHGFLHQAVVNRWAEALFLKLESLFPGFQIKRNTYDVYTTIDIDNAWAYLEKGLVRTLAGFAKSILTLNFKTFSERLKVILGLEKDAYDTYDYQELIQEKYKLKIIYFILLGDYGKNDKNIPFHSRKFQQLIKSLADIGTAGIHPSFGSNNSPKRLEKEIKRLENIIKRDVVHSRQHFLKLRLPDTYRNLIEFGVKNDYTMGYASKPGFRAGICSPFYFYDLDMELETNLKIHPFAFMEGTFKYYMNLSPEEAKIHVSDFIEEVKKYNGVFISLWHNDSLNDRGIWKGWRSLFEEMQEASIK